MLEQLDITRIAATPAALDEIDAGDAIVLRIAADEVLVIGGPGVDVADEHAIVLHDTGWVGAWVAMGEAASFLRRTCEFHLPGELPALAQGMVAHLAVKLWLEHDRVLFVVPRAVAADFEHRYSRATGEALE